MDRLSRLWHGELPLEEAFWHWAVAGGLIVNVTSSFLFLVLVVLDRSFAAILVGYAPSLPYNFIVTVGVWRSAERYSGDAGWANLAKLVTLAAMIALSLT